MILRSSAFLAKTTGRAQACTLQRDGVSGSDGALVGGLAGGDTGHVADQGHQQSNIKVASP